MLLAQIGPSRLSRLRSNARRPPMWTTILLLLRACVGTVLARPQGDFVLARNLSGPGCGRKGCRCRAPEKAVLNLEAIGVRPVERSEERFYQGLMQAHHYLGALPKIGERSGTWLPTTVIGWHC